MTPAEHYKEAEEAIRASTYQRQEWGAGKGDAFLHGAFWEMERAQVHATLALYQAISEDSDGDVNELAVARETEKAV